MKNVATPLKQMRLLLSPKLLSPLSPVINARPRKCETCIKRVVKKLDFTGKVNIESSIKINVIKCESPPDRTDLINFKCLNSSTVSEDDLRFLNGENRRRDLLMNTPNKLKILKHGLNMKGKYNVLGRGSFGTVVKGVYKGENVAVKVIKTKTKLNEINALKLRHENVIQMRDVITQTNDHSIIIMEFLENSAQLQTLLHNESFTLNEQTVKKYALDICKGLMYCHEQKVLHLDLKPVNILVCGGEVCKICDFGSSRIVGDIERDYVHEGTVAYTAPEILIGNKPTFASDVYSVGIIFWQLRHRENPYSSLQNKDVIIYKVVKYGLRPNHAKETDSSDEFVDLYKKCWSGMEDDRPSLFVIISTLQGF